MVDQEILRLRRARRGKHFPSTIKCFGHGGFFMTYSSEYVNASGRKAWRSEFHPQWLTAQRVFGYCWRHCP